MQPAAANVIGGVEVRTELRPTGVACLAQVTDFGADELVVVRRIEAAGSKRKMMIKIMITIMKKSAWRIAGDR